MPFPTPLLWVQGPSGPSSEHGQHRLLDPVCQPLQTQLVGGSMELEVEKSRGVGYVPSSV